MSIRPCPLAPTCDAPTPAGPYSQAVRAGGLLFLAGQGGYLPASRELAGPGIEIQTRQTFLNIEAVLEHAGSSLAHLLKVTVYLRDIGQREEMNREYARWVHDPLPARTTVEAGLAEGLLIEVDVIARDPNEQG